MRYFHEINNEEAVDALAEIMMSLDDDLEVTVKPMRRDSHWAGVRVYLKRDELHWVPDPLYCHLLWLDKWIARNELNGFGAGYQRKCRDNLVAQLDRQWGM